MQSAHRHLASVLFALALGSCGGGVAIYPVAVGAHGTLPTWNGPCDPASASGDAVTIEAGSYVATHDGDVELECERGRVRLEVRSAARLRIDGPNELGAQWATYRLVATTREGRELDLGAAEVVWTVSDGVERGSSCHGDILPRCEAPSIVRLRTAVGRPVRLEASLGVARASRSLNER